jgi:PAS domain S-box-containing protein
VCTYKPFIVGRAALKSRAPTLVKTSAITQRTRSPHEGFSQLPETHQITHSCCDPTLLEQKEVLPHSRHSPRESAVNILVVDDRTDKLIALAAVIADLGQNVITAQSGREALRHLLRQDFAVILLDVNMPGMDGFETASIIRARDSSRHTPIIFLSAIYDAEKYLSRGYSLGAVDYLLTPIPPEILRTKVSVFVELFRKTEQVRRQAERLRQSEERFRLLMEGVKDYAIYMLDAAGCVASWNPAAEQITGYGEEEIIGKHYSCFFPREDVERERPDHKLKIVATAGRLEDEGWRIRKDGSRFWANVIITALRDENAKLRGFAKVTRDITARKHLEKQLLEISDREQRRIGQDLHDDLCQQLTGIEFMSQSLEQNLVAGSIPEAAAAADITKLIRNAISHTRNLARGLSPVLLETDGLMLALRELAGSSAKLFNVSCQLQYDSLVLIEDSAVAIHLYRIVQEAVSNAIKHGRASEVAISLSKNGRHVTLCIEDNGVGFPARRNNRAGMGLHIMEYRAGMIGGSLAVQPRAGGGTSVTCSIQNPSEK